MSQLQGTIFQRDNKAWGCARDLRRRSSVDAAAPKFGTDSVLHKLSLVKLRSDERTVSVAVSHLQRHCIFLYEVKIKARSQSLVQLNALLLKLYFF